MENKKTVIAIVVTYNRKKLLMECIESLIHQTDSEKLSVLVIDNNSTDGTYDYIRKYIVNKKVIYKNTGINLGGAGGFEFGIRSALKMKCDYVWIMDDDCVPSKDALKQFLLFDEECKLYGFLSSFVLWKNKEICTMNIQRKNIAHKLTKNDFKQRAIPIQFATFVSIFIPTDIVLEVGVPIGDFFVWGDDWEYTRRISKKYPCYALTTSIVFHKTSHNKGCDISNDSAQRISRYKYMFRNNMFICKSEGINGRIYYWLKIAKDIMKVLLKAKNRKKERINTIIEGIKEGLSFNPVSVPITNETRG